MRGKRLRLSQKRLMFYKLHFGVTAPYRLLVDGTFCNAALQNKVNLAEQVPKYFQAEVKMCTTNCAIAELKSFGHTMMASLKILSQFPVVECKHGEPIPVFHCFKSKYKFNKMTTSKTKYCIATQDQQLRDVARKFGAVPLLYLHSKALTLEPPSDVSKDLANKHEEHIKSTPMHHKEAIEKMKKINGEDSQTEVKRRKRKRPKGPNPLSCKPKKKRQMGNMNSLDKTKSRKRKKKKPREEVDLKTVFKELKSKVKPSAV